MWGPEITLNHLNKPQNNKPPPPKTDYWATTIFCTSELTNRKTVKTTNTHTHEHTKPHSQTPKTRIVSRHPSQKEHLFSSWTKPTMFGKFLFLCIICTLLWQCFLGIFVVVSATHTSPLTKIKFKNQNFRGGQFLSTWLAGQTFWPKTCLRTHGGQKTRPRRPPSFQGTRKPKH